MSARHKSTMMVVSCFCSAAVCCVSSAHAAMDAGGGGTPQPTIEELIVETQLFLDEAAAAGTIEGRGWGWIAEFHLALMQYALDEAMLAYQSETMDVEGAYRWLTYAYQLCDQARWPINDSVVGPQVTELNAKLVVVLKRITYLL